MAEATLSIGTVAGMAGVNVSTIRFYERRGLLPEPERVGGQRRYGPEVVERLHVIQAAKHGGLSLEEIGRLLDATDRGAPAHEQLRALAAEKLPELEAQARRLQAARDWLGGAAACGCKTLESCALFAAAQ